MTKKVRKEVPVILTQNIQNLGKAGTLIDLRSGYARNYIIPKKLGNLATPETIKLLALKQKELELKEKAQIEIYKKNKSTLEQIGQFVIKKRIGEDNKIFGKITLGQIREMIEEKTNLNLNKVTIEVPEIKELGTFIISIIFHPMVKANIKLEVLAQ